MKQEIQNSVNRTSVKIIQNDKGSFDCEINLKEITGNPIVLLQTVLNDYIDEKLKQLNHPDKNEIFSRQHSLIRIVELRDSLNEELKNQFPVWDKFYL